MKEPVQHFIDGRESWREGFFGSFSRYRNVASVILINLITGGWVAYLQFYQSTIAKIIWVPRVSIVGYIVISFVAILILLINNRKTAIKTAQLDRLLHQIAHELREISLKAEKYTLRSARINRGDALNFLQTEFGKTVCNHLREFFRTALKKDDVECAIRISNRTDNNPNNPPHYCTIGRSNGLNKKRDNECYIPANKGIPKLFLELNRNRTGVLVYHDIDRAASDGSYLKTQNDYDFPGDIRALMVAPINGWDGEKNSMLGLLYVTARTNHFSRKNVDSLRMLSDLLGIVTSRIVSCLYAERKVIINVKQGGH